jgi:allantoinase
MSENPLLDTVIKNVRVVRPHHDGVELLDLGIKDGKYVQIAPHISPDSSENVFDGKNLLGFPGVVDAHWYLSTPGTRCCD